MGLELRLLHDLPIVSINIVYKGKILQLERVLLDTGSVHLITYWSVDAAGNIETQISLELM